MTITILYGSAHRGNTHACVKVLKDALEELEAEPILYREFFLPRDMPMPCEGCGQCFSRGSEHCPHAALVMPISEAISQADAVLFATPVYALEVSSGMKCLLDHLCYRWLVHRPDPRSFHTPGLCVATTLGRGAGAALRTLQKNMRFLGMARWRAVGFEMGMPTWAEVPASKLRRMRMRMKRQAHWLHRQMRRSTALHPDLFTRLIMEFVRRFVHARYGGGPDVAYWKQHGWHEGKLPF